MYIKKDIDFEEIKENSWSGAADTIETVEEHEKEEELMNLLENVFEDDIPTETELNDFLWFEDDYIFESLGIGDEEDL